MPKKRTTNRDHAKRLLGFVPWSGNPTGRTPQQRPMMEDEAIAAHLSDLVTPALIAQEKSALLS
jgi:hypothetical protein